MKKRWYLRFSMMIILLVSILGTGFSIEKWQVNAEKQQVSTGSVANQKVIPGGMPIGIYMRTDGVLVLGTDTIKGMDGNEYRPAEHLVKEGDYIVAINNQKVESKKDLISVLNRLNSKEIVLGIRREGETILVKLEAVMTSKDTYKLGIWVRDSLQGLGTVTYITQDNQFGALGHGIHDSDIGELLEIAEGRVYSTEILRIQKGKKGTPGGMEGMIVYNHRNILGSIEQNTDNGIYGTINDVGKLSEDQEAIPVCLKNDTKKGAAIIRCCVDGEVKEYDIEILKINRFSFEANKGMVIKITDEELLKTTGGIVQGMSGSPILQDGKLVGAVTHVLVNDPTKGYGIFVEEMME